MQTRKLAGAMGAEIPGIDWSQGLSRGRRAGVRCEAAGASAAPGIQCFHRANSHCASSCFRNSMHTRTLADWAARAADIAHTSRVGLTPAARARAYRLRMHRRRTSDRP